MGKAEKIQEMEEWASIEGEKGLMPFDEGNELSSHDIVSSDQIDDVLMMLDEMDIDVVEDLQRVKGEEEKVLDKEEEGEGVETEVFGRATDPVRMYLKEMGTVSLLTREGEVEIAKRIERGKKEMLGIVLSCPMAVREIIHLGNAIKTGKVQIREVTNELDEEEPSIEEEQAQQKKILERVDRIQRMDEGIREVLKHRALSPGKIQEQVRKKQREIVNCFNEMNVRDSQVNKIVQKMTQVLARI